MLPTDSSMYMHVMSSEVAVHRLKNKAIDTFDPILTKGVWTLTP